MDSQYGSDITLNDKVDKMWNRFIADLCLWTSLINLNCFSHENWATMVIIS